MVENKETPLDLDALLAAASEVVDEETEAIKKELDEAQRFMLALDLKRGTEKIAAILVYEYYSKWRGKSKHKLRDIPFFKQFSKYFERIRSKHGTYYLLNPAPFDLSDEKFWEVRKQMRSRKALKRRQRDQKTTSKKQGQKSGPKETLPQ